MTLPALDRLLVPAVRRGRPRVFTLHYPLPPASATRAVRTQRRLLAGFDAVISHTEQAAARLRTEFGLDPARVHVIPHGPLDYLTRIPERERAPLPAELAGTDPDTPVVLFFGLLRPYKGVDTLLEAFREIEGAELWIAGMPRMPIEPLRELAAKVKALARPLPAALRRRP